MFLSTVSGRLKQVVIIRLALAGVSETAGWDFRALVLPGPRPNETSEQIRCRSRGGPSDKRDGRHLPRRATASVLAHGLTDIDCVASSSSRLFAKKVLAFGGGRGWRDHEDPLEAQGQVESSAEDCSAADALRCSRF